MIRSIICVSILCAFFAGCASGPGSVSSKQMVRFGAGTMEEDDAPLNKAAGPVNSVVSSAPRPKSEVMKQAELLDSQMDGNIASGNLPAALDSFNLITELLEPYQTRVALADSQMKESGRKIESALSQVVIEAVSSPAETSAGTAFKTAFSARISTMSGAERKPLAGFACIATYPASSGTGEKILLTEKLVSDPSGLVSFKSPVPFRSGRDTVLITVKAPGLSSATVGRLSVSFNYLVGTSAKSVPTTISMLDFDKTGKSLAASSTSGTNLLIPLVKKGFTRIGMADFPVQLASGDEVALLKAAKTQFGSAVQRFIFGTVRVESVSLGADGLWSCTVAAKISVVNLLTNEKLHEASLSHTETAKTEAAAIDAARKKMAGEILVNDLNYNL